MALDKSLHVTVHFGPSIPQEIEGPALLRFEKLLREMAPNLWIEVFKEYMGDDSKLRSQMTPEQRAKL